MNSVLRNTSPDILYCFYYIIQLRLFKARPQITQLDKTIGIPNTFDAKIRNTGDILETKYPLKLIFVWDRWTGKYRQRSARRRSISFIVGNETRPAVTSREVIAK